MKFLKQFRDRRSKDKRIKDLEQELDAAKVKIKHCRGQLEKEISAHANAVRRERNAMSDYYTMQNEVRGYQDRVISLTANGITMANKLKELGHVGN